MQYCKLLPEHEQPQVQNSHGADPIIEFVQVHAGLNGEIFVWSSRASQISSSHSQFGNVVLLRVARCHLIRRA